LIDLSGLVVQVMQCAKNVNTTKHVGVTMKLIRMTTTEPNQAMEVFQSKFPIAQKPMGAFPEIPSNLDDLSDSSLMSMYVEFMAWLSYAKAELVTAEISEERCASDCRLQEAGTLIQQWSGDKGDTVTLAKARRDTDDDVIYLQDKHLNSRAYRKLVESVFERCERGTQVLSRELSRRISIAPQERRLHRYAP